MNGITKKVYYLNARDDVIIKAPISRVTHWMPLPEPPSGTIEITYNNGEKYTACLADSYDNVMACLLDDDSVSVSHGIGKAEEDE